MLIAQNYTPSLNFTGDLQNRPGHSNSTPPDNMGGNMGLPSECIQVESNLLVVGSSATDLGNFFVHKKNANTGASIQWKYIKLYEMLGQQFSVSRLCGAKYDALTDRIYLYGKTSASGYSGFIICLNQTTMDLDTSFDGDGFQMFYSGSYVKDLIVTGNQKLIALVRNSNNSTFQLTELTNGGQWTANYSMSGVANRIKAYPSKTNRYFVVGSANVWGFDRVQYKNQLPFFSLIANSPILPYTFEDLCFPMNSSTGICDIVAVGNNSTWDEISNDGWAVPGNGIYIKFKGSLSAVPYNMAIVTSYSNQSSVPGLGIASNLPQDASNFTFFSRCEVVGNNVVVLGSYHNLLASVGLINNSGSSYTRLYVAPASGGYYVHLPKGFFVNNLNEIFLSGCDTGLGLTSIKLIPN